MKQALHIFKKDVRRLWLLISILIVTIVLFALELNLRIGLRWTSNSLAELLVVPLIWFLISLAIHEESLPGENQFWLTRPYDRRSLLLAKIMMAVVVVALPLFIADCVILSELSFSVAGNFGGLILRQFVKAAWLIVPPFAVASVTRNLSEDLMVWIAGVAVVLGAYFPNSQDEVREVYGAYAIAVALILLAVIVWRQYSQRRTMMGRVLLAVTVLLPAVPYVQGPVFALAHGGSGDAAVAGVSIRVAAANAPGGWISYGKYGNKRCQRIEVIVDGMRPGWRLEVLGENSTFESDGSRRSSGWLSVPRENLTDPPVVDACMTGDGLKTMNTGKPISARVALAMVVVTDDAAVSRELKATASDVPGIGRCQLHPNPFGLSSRTVVCMTPVWSPPQGKNRLTAGADSWESKMRSDRYPWMPMNLLPGLSPVYGWDTLKLQSETAETPRVTFTPEKRIGLLMREVFVPDVRLPEGQ